METDLKAPVTVNIEDEMQQSYMDYAMSVIVGRALPDARDGLKPVQRRVLYAMWREGLTSNKKTTKCAGVVGEVLKSLHPHGDSSVYNALVRLAQPWSMRYPLVDGQGNFGSIDGDPAAAYRYTECRMTALSERLLSDIDKDTVDFMPNFDETDVEPLVLPTTVPSLLVNGADGIAVGMATHIPPHNLTEVIKGTIALINNPKLSLSELMRLIPGPDFPTGGIIIGRQAISSAYSNGKGIIQLRAKTSIEQISNKQRTIDCIVVSEIPFQLNKARLIEKIADLVNSKMIEGISKVRDESDRTGMRIVMELKRDATPEVVLNQLFKHTPLQSSFGIINLAIIEGKPVVCGLIELLNQFINHRRDVVTRRTLFELKKARERMHLLDGFRIALLNIDDIIKLIKAAQTAPEARANLIAKYELSEVQAQAILDLRLQKLTGMERLSVEKEHAELVAEIARLCAILADDKEIDTVIVNELEEVAGKFGDARRTEISDQVGEIEIEDLIEDEEMVVTVSHNGYVKRTAANSYRAQKRGGKGMAGAAALGEDFVEHLFVSSTLADLMVFSSLGRLYWLKVYEIPEAGRTARGRALVNLLTLREGEDITAVLPLRKETDGRVVVMATKSGVIKRTELANFKNSRRTGLMACTLKPGDELIGVGLTRGQDDIILATKNGMAIRFNEDRVREVGRIAQGVRGISLKDDDQVVGMTIVSHNIENGDVGENRTGASATLLTVCENGYGKRTKLSDYRVQNRGGIGLIDIRTNQRNGPVVGVSAVDDDSQLMLITSSSKIIRTKAAGISVIGRNTQGVRLIDLEEGEKVAAIAQLDEQDDD